MENIIRQQQTVKQVANWVKANFFSVALAAGLLLLLQNIIFVSCQL